MEAVHDFTIAALWPESEPVSDREYRDRALLDSAVSRQTQTAFNEEIHKTLAEKAAALFHGLISNHPFHNGNKRTAAVCLNSLLMANDCVLALSQTELEELARETATYRQRGIGHDEMLKRLTTVMNENLVSREELERHPEFEGLCKAMEVVKRGVEENCAADSAK